MSERSAATDFWGVTTENTASNKPSESARTTAKELGVQPTQSLNFDY